MENGKRKTENFLVFRFSLGVGKRNRRQLTHEARAEAKFTLIMPCKKEENGTLSRAQRVLAHYAEARRRKSPRRGIKTESTIKKRLTKFFASP